MILFQENTQTDEKTNGRTEGWTDPISFDPSKNNQKHGHCYTTFFITKNFLYFGFLVSYLAPFHRTFGDIIL